MYSRFWCWLHSNQFHYIALNSAEQQNTVCIKNLYFFYTAWNSTIWSTRQEQQSTTHSSFPGWRGWWRSSRAVFHCHWTTANAGKLQLVAIFHLLCAHYIFNLQYHPKGRELLTFLQEKWCISPAPSTKEALLLSHISGISRYANEDN